MTKVVKDNSMPIRASSTSAATYNANISMNPAAATTLFSKAEPDTTSSSAMKASATIKPSPIPKPVPAPKDNPDTDEHNAEHKADTTPSSSDNRKPPSLCPTARLRIHLDDLGHPATTRVTKVVPLSTLIPEAITHVQNHLFTPPSSTATSNPTLQTRPPPQRPIHPPSHYPTQEVRSMTLTLRPMDGVAYTTGTPLDESHKEIHLSLTYLDSKSTQSDHSFLHELLGVVTHEMVHVFQHDARGTAPGGLIEGIADFVRLKAGLGATHWAAWPASEKSRGEKWDEGYQKTAWFLEWVERQIGGMGCVVELNREMKGRDWEGGKVWKDVVGVSVEECWRRYREDWEGMNRRHEKEEGGKDEEN